MRVQLSLLRKCSDGGQTVSKVDSVVFKHFLAAFSDERIFAQIGKGVKVTFSPDNSISIDLHIMVDKSVNLSAIASSIISEVRYFVTKSTGTEVRAVNVFVDSISVD